MKVLHLITDENGGAGRAALRINDALNQSGIESKVLFIYGDKLRDDLVQYIPLFKNVVKLKIYEKINLHHVNRFAPKTYFSAEKYGISLKDIPEVKKADVIHIHWINKGIWSDRFAKELILLQKPVVWTLHDMWAYTGGCHYNGECERYVKGCGNCEGLANRCQKDISRELVAKKLHYYKQMNLCFIGCSEWITNEAKKSYIVRKLGIRCECIPNTIDMNLFTVHDRSACKKILNIQTDKKVILFGAMTSTTDRRKGYHLLKEAISHLDRDEYALAIFGNSSLDDDMKKYEIIDFGQVNDDVHLSLIYNIADVFVAPSIQENLANTVMESLSCGTPVVAFRVGGMPDMIHHKKNGYLAECFDTDDLCEGIRYLCKGEENGIKRDVIHEMVENDYHGRKISRQYAKIYEEVKQK